MNIIETLLLAVSLSMDAFSVALCKGLARKKVTLRDLAVVGLWFGIFQALMPLIGYSLGSTFAEKISSVGHFIAFGLLVLVGVQMIREAFSKSGEKSSASSLGFKVMLILAIATSIDALAVGVSFAFTPFNPPQLVYAAFLIIGVTTFLLSAAGMKIGSIFGTKYRTAAECAGGIILILLGTKILLEGLKIL